MLINNEFKPYMLESSGSQNAPKQKKQSRISIVLGLIGLAFTGLASFSFGYQEYFSDQLNSMSANRIRRSITEPALRGTITDRNGVPLAVSRHKQVATFNPRQIAAPKHKGGAPNLNAVSADQIAKLAALLKLPESEVREKLADIKSGYLRFPTELTLEEAAKVKALGIPTLRFEARIERSYPTGSLFSHIIGVANTEGKGLEGLEYAYNQKLSGTDGKQLVLRDKDGNIIEMLDDDPENRPAQEGQTLVLSVDETIQRLAHEQLAAALKTYNAKAGGVVVLDAQTGEILAMSSLPDYNANFYNEFPAGNLRNYAVGVTNEPGSVMKPFVIAKALDEGKISRYSQFNTQPYELSGKTIKDTHLYPSLSTEGILQKSSNVGTSRVAALFSNEELYDYYRSVGFGRKTSSGISGEQSAQLKPAAKWSKLDKAVMSYGYAVTANLLQLAQGYTVFTTDGRLLPATIFKRDGKVEGEQIIKPDTARQMREMMVSITEKGGTGQSGAIPGYDVAGKTGTAKKNSGRKGYEDRYVASFVGFAPADNPRLIVADSIDEPHGKGYYGGTVAGPVFREVMAGSLKILGVKPSYAVAEPAAVQTAAAKKR